MPYLTGWVGDVLNFVIAVCYRMCLTFLSQDDLIKSIIRKHFKREIKLY